MPGVLLILFWVIFTSLLSAQAGNYAIDSVVGKDGSQVPYLFIGNPAQPKPVLLFVYGSLPAPVMVTQAKGEVSSTLPFRYQNYLNKYHVLVVSKKCIPLEANYKQLDNRGSFVDAETRRIPDCFREGNAATDEVDRHLAVIEHLRSRSVIRPGQFLVVGHSAGARVATGIAAASPSVSHLAYLSSEPRGRYYEILRRTQAKVMSDSTALPAALARWEKIVQDRNNREFEYGDSYRTTFSHSADMVPELLSLSIPIYVTWGSADVKSAGMMAIPYEFIRAGKTNLTYKIYHGMEHNFFKVNDAGGIDYDRYYFPAVIDTIVNWAFEG